MFKISRRLLLFATKSGKNEKILVTKTQVVVLVAVQHFTKSGLESEPEKTGSVSGHLFGGGAFGLGSNVLRVDLGQQLQQEFVDRLEGLVVALLREVQEVVHVVVGDRAVGLE